MLSVPSSCFIVLLNSASTFLPLPPVPWSSNTALSMLPAPSRCGLPSVRNAMPSARSTPGIGPRSSAEIGPVATPTAVSQVTGGGGHEPGGFKGILSGQGTYTKVEG